MKMCLIFAKSAICSEKVVKDFQQTDNGYQQKANSYYIDMLFLCRSKCSLRKKLCFTKFPYNPSQ